MKLGRVHKQNLIAEMHPHLLRPPLLPPLRPPPPLSLGLLATPPLILLRSTIC